MSLENIRIVMDQTYHPGNIGAAARAMKNMGLSSLYLINPRCFPDDEATSRAAGALDILENTTVVSSLDEAIEDCSLVIGTSARSRSFPRPVLSAKDSAAKLATEANQGPVALLFGRERMGLESKQLERCHFHTEIPANPDYPILNVSSAIQILCYEIWQYENGESLRVKEESEENVVYPSVKEVELFNQHLEETLRDTGFLNDIHQGEAMNRLIRLANRVRPEQKELRMLRGILNSIQEVAGKK
ncbi:RNA methyltransferase [Litoribrevibacter albus]|uniref:tRNA (cytidine/uridine-2'-O-)-methyltransferase TrmJ n=1 Tax=Litoribrevibacter albus TaxID=1473156 RepID=A0AA37W8B6_9GAMM|nr:TrmJ/YjtD family RNA methyltransferase [Litoribrevibacter albus]GLQ33702.1 tRNA (cytidine/uridine-2'-O-)-methyltransferase TrmJ [Litoribrevibacter albus]